MKNSAFAMPGAETLARFAAITGERHALSDPAAMAPYLSEWRDKYVGRAAMVLRPGSVEEVSQILALANDRRVAIVPQGGNTGLVGGQVPFEEGNEVVVSLGRLNRILSIDAQGNTLTAQAGCTLAAIQHAAQEAGRLFPLSLGSEGSCQIGGNLATNAGGVAVLSFGNAREQVLGLEVVLADGRVWDGLRSLRKDNTGYDLKQLFLGSEGTLGVITAAVLKLFPRALRRETALVAVPAVAQAVALLAFLRERLGEVITACELIPALGMTLSLQAIGETQRPFAEQHAWQILIEAETSSRHFALREALEEALAEAVDEGLATD
ncbi:MAG TPA: FAD-binding oxidoreductase, partial [Hyphomicrobiales bacterium]|nr:FAD-binding oxidoreductase [Hyphomicrobiales bacterium]